MAPIPASDFLVRIFAFAFHFKLMCRIAAQNHLLLKYCVDSRSLYRLKTDTEKNTKLEELQPRKKTSFELI